MHSGHIGAFAYSKCDYYISVSILKQTQLWPYVAVIDSAAGHTHNNYYSKSCNKSGFRYATKVEVHMQGSRQPSSDIVLQGKLFPL